MVLLRITAFHSSLKQILQLTSRNGLPQRSTHFRSGALRPKPDEKTFGLVGVICAVIPGLFIGATISKNVANFLEENDLFVPSDDDDDDD